MKFIRGMYGLGDNIYQRAFVRQLPGCTLQTAWPQLYTDLDIKCAQGLTSLRAQSANIKAQPATMWTGRAPAGPRELKIGYGPADFRNGSLIDAMARQFGVRPRVWDLPPLPPPPVQGDYVLVRPVTVRSEWRNEARNPRSEYVAQVAEELRQRYRIVSVAWLERGAEWLDGAPPLADETYHAGEFDALQLLSLVKHAKAVVGGIGWLFPAAICAGTPAFFLLGGNGAHNAPERITHPSMDLTKLGYGRPDRLCMCEGKAHACDKRISRLSKQVAEWRTRTGV